MTNIRVLGSSFVRAKAMLWAGAAVGLCALSGAAFAQDTSAGRAGTTADEAPPNTGDLPAPGPAIEEIVVTAQRVEQRLQDVPLSITAIGGEALKNANVTNIDRIEQLAPGVRIGRSGSDARPSIRGTFTENIAANGDPRIGFYVDDIYQSRTSQALVAFTDIERIEVQKGPQGTLYGRNSFGGNIAVYTATPKDEFSAGIDALYGNFNRRRVEGFVNVPVTDGIAARVAGLWEKADGYIKNLGTGSDLGDEDQYYLRGSLLIAPDALDGRLEILLRGSYWNQDGNGFSGFGYKSIGTLVDESLIRQPGGSITVGGFTYDFPNGFNGNSFSGRPVPINSRYRDGVPDIGGADIGVPVAPGPYRIDSDVDAIRRTRQEQYSATIDYDADFAKLRSITSYTKFYANRSADQDFSPAPLAIDFNETRNRTFTQELQLLSNDSTSPFQWIVGAYYFQDKTTEKFHIQQNREYSTAIALATGQFPLYSFSFTYLPTLAANGFGQYRNDSINPVQARTKSYAGYAQASYTFNDRLTLTAGYRYTSDRKRYSAVLGAPGFFPLMAPPGSTLPAYVGYSLEMPVNFECGAITQADPNRSNLVNTNALIARCARKTFNFSTFRGAVDYKLTDDNMIYASIATGRHSGGFNNTLNPTTLEPIPFDPEKVTAYEIGSKNQFLDGTLQLNIAAFYNDYTDLQVQTSIPNPQGTGVLGLVSNAGKTEAYGIEMEAIVKPTRQLTVNLAFNWLHARETEYQVNTFGYFGGFGICTVSPGPTCAAFPAAGIAVQGTPFPNPISNPDRFVPVLGPDGQQIVAGGIPQFNYVIAGTGSDGREYSSRVALSPEYTAQVGVAYDIDLGNAGTLTPSVQSYFNSGYILTDLTPNFGDQDAYTKTDLRLTYVSADERFTVQAYVENLEDTAVINRVAYGNFRSLNGSYAFPRTYGIKAGVRF